MLVRRSLAACAVLVVVACFKAPHDAEYDSRNPNKVYFAGRIVNAVGIPIAGALVNLDTDTWDTTGVEGSFVADPVDPGIYTLEVIPPDPLCGTFRIDGGCSLWAGRVIEDTTFYFKRALWNMESSTGVMPEHWRPDTCGWQIVPDRDAAGNKVLAMRPNPFVFGPQGRALCDDVFAGDFIFEVGVKPLSTNHPGSSWQAGVLWCYQDRNNYCRFRISEANLAASYCINSVSDTFFVVAPGRLLGEWYRIRIERLGSITKVFLNGAQVGRDIDRNPLAQGKIGLWVQAETPGDSIAFYYDNIWVEPTK